MDKVKCSIAKKLFDTKKSAIEHKGKIIVTEI